LQRIVSISVLFIDDVKFYIFYKVKKLFVLTATATLLFTLNRCYINDYENIDEVKVESFSPNFGFPVVNSSVSLSDLLETADDNTFVEVRNDSIIIRFSQNMNFELDLNNFSVPDKDFTFTLPITEDSFEFYQEDYATIGSDSEIKRIDFRGGEFFIEFERSTADEVEAELVITSLKTDGQPDGLAAVADWSDNPFVSRHEYELSGSSLDLYVVEGADTIYNSIEYGFGVTSPAGSSGDVTVRFGFSGIGFERITGKIFHEIDLPAQEIDLGALSSVVDGEIYLENPSLGFAIGTSFGTPSSITINEIKFVNFDNEIRFLENTGEFVEDDLLIGEKNFLPFGTDQNPYVRKLFNLDGNNSNLDQILPFSPNKISFSGNFALGDTDQEILNPHDFYVADTSSFDMDMDVEIPLSGRIEGLRFRQVISGLSWPELDSVDMIDDYSVTLLLKTVNGIPLTFGLQADFLDDNDNIVASLFDTEDEVENIIESPDIDQNGDPVEGFAREKFTVIELSREKYEAISSSTRTEFVLRVDSGTETRRNVNIKASQFINIQISVALEATIDPE
jgi:hypothetical protein